MVSGSMCMYIYHCHTFTVTDGEWLYMYALCVYITVIHSQSQMVGGSICIHCVYIIVIHYYAISYPLIIKMIIIMFSQNYYARALSIDNKSHIIICYLVCRAMRGC